MKSLTGPIIKSLIFIVVTVLTTGLLAITIANGNTGGGQHFSAVFSDATALNVGDDVRMAGVRVGQVSSVGIEHRRNAKVGFSLNSDVRLAQTTTATLRYRNLIGQRYVELDEGDGSLGTPMHSGATIPLSRTTPALDLTVLFNGFEPLFQALNPQEINQLSAEIIQVFQGEGPTIGNLLSQTATLTTTLAQKDDVIGEVIDNLNDVLARINGRSGQLTNLISTLSSLVSVLAADRAPLGQALTSLGGLTGDVSALLQQGRAPLRRSIVSLGRLSANLSGSSDALNSFLVRLPNKLTRVGRLGSYGSWLNFYLCSVSGRIPVPGDFGNPSATLGGAPDPTGLVGAKVVAKRCGA